MGKVLQSNCTFSLPWRSYRIAVPSTTSPDRAQAEPHRKSSCQDILGGVLSLLECKCLAPQEPKQADRQSLKVSNKAHSSCGLGQ